MFNVLNIWCQYPVEEEYVTQYFINFSSFYSGSGYPVGYTMNMEIQKGKKALSAGIIYHGHEKLISGSFLTFRIYYGRFEEPFSYIKPLQTFFQYNLIYHRISVTENVLITNTGKLIEVSNNEVGEIATMEHYFTSGLKVKIVNGFYITITGGIGVYIGSLSKMHKPNTLGIHGVNEGLTMFVNFGMQYHIARQRKSSEI